MLKQLICPNTNNKDDDTEFNHADPDPEFSIMRNKGFFYLVRHKLAESEPCNLCREHSRNFSQMELRHPPYQMAHKKNKSFSTNGCDCEEVLAVFGR